MDDLVGWLVGDPPGLSLLHLPTGQAVLEPPPGGSWALAVQTTASSSRRRWRSGPVGWPRGPAGDPPDDGWLGATGVLDLDPPAATGPAGAGPRLRALLATADPAGRRLVLEVGPAAAGGAAVEVHVDGDREGVEAVAAAFAAAPGERWLGFGERSDRAVRAGGVVEHYVGEGPYQEWEYPFLDDLVPPWGIRQRPDATYFPLPVALSTRGVAVSVVDDEVSYARLRPAGAPRWSWEVEAPRLRLLVHPGPRPLDALRRHTAATGCQPEPDRWWWGPWYQTGHANHVPLDEERRQLRRLRAAGAPASAAETHCRYLPLGEHRGHEAEEADRTAHLHGEGLAVLSYLNPLLAEEHAELFDPAAADGGMSRHADGSPYLFDAYAGGREPPVAREGHLDLSTAAGVAAFEAAAAALVDAGHDGWMEDFGEYTPLDAHLGAGGGPAGTAGHNRYPTTYHAAAAAVAQRLGAAAGRRLARFVRSGWTGTAAHAPIVWGGDPTTGWGFDGLASVVTGALSAGASGIAMWGSDIGGFLSSVDVLDVELLVRWIQLGAATPVMRTKAGGIAPPGVVRPQIWDDEVLPHWCRWAALHTALNDYLAAAHGRYRATGHPVAAALALVHPEDPGCLDVEDELLLGPDLLVAPVLDPGRRVRTVVLPPGAWVDLWRILAVGPGGRELTPLGGAAGHVHRGPGVVDLPAPLDELPLLLRAGAVLPLLAADVDSLSPYRAPGVVSAADREGEGRLLAVPGPDWDGELAPGRPARSRTGGRGWVLDLPGDGVRRRLLADCGLTGLAGGPVEVRGAAPGWRWDPGAATLDAEVAGGRLEVRPA